MKTNQTLEKREAQSEATVQGQMELRVKVAELCGWIWGQEYNRREARFVAPKGYVSPSWRTSDPDNAILWPYNGRTLDELRIDLIDGLPDYCNDLNAMHELEKIAPIVLYARELEKVCNEWSKSGRCFLPFHCATAHQRAEAFVATMESR